MTWFWYSVGATLCFGMMASCYRLPSVRGLSRAAVTLWMLVVQSLLAFLFFHGSLKATTSATLAFGGLWGGAFACLVLLQMYALAHVETGVLLPITSAGSLILSVGVGLLLFHDSVSAVQLIGIALATLGITEFLWRASPIKLTTTVLTVGGSIVILSAFGKVLQGIAAGQVDVYALQIWQYGFGTLIALIATGVIHRGAVRAQFSRSALLIGTLIASLSFVGGALLYQALVRGPFPLVTTVHSSYIFVTALVSWWLFHEPLTARKVSLLGLAIVGIGLIRLG